LNRFLLIILLFQFGFSQQNFHQTWYSADTEHLPQNSVKSISPDKYGFIWMTTENGLVRFDGKNFKTYNSSNRGVLTNRFLYLSGSIEKDSLRTFTERYVDNVVINNRNAIKTKKNYYLTSFDEYENNRFYINNTNNLQIDFLKSKIKNSKGEYYKIEKDRIILFNKKNQKKKEVEHLHNSNDDYFLLNDDLVCLSSNGDYLFFNHTISKNNKLFISKNSKRIYNHLTQQYFICTNNEIYIIKKTTNNLYLSLLYKEDKSLKYDIKCLFYEIKCNKLFIGTGDKGIGIITLNKFGILTNPNSINNTYYATTPFSKDNILTAKGEVFNKNGFITDIKLNQTGYQYGITIDRQENIWIQNNTNLICYYKKTNYKTFKKIEFKSIISTIYCDSENKIWIGFRKDDGTQVFVATINANDSNLKPEFQKILNEPVNFFVETKANKMLMSCLNNRIIEYDKTTKKVVKLSSGKNDIRSIFICNDNKTWVCTYSNGFSLFENNKFYKLPVDNNSYLTSAHCINEDSKGHFWISTNKGLIEVDKKSLLKHIKEKSPIYYHHYDTKNGFLTNEFNGGCQPCNSKLDNGYFVYPSLNGLVTFHPEKVNKILPSGDFYINEVVTENRTIYFKDTLFTSRKNNRFKIKIDFAYFGNENNIHFEAKLLLEEDDKWTNLHNEKSISFTNLPPGKHTLFIRKLGDFSSKYQTKKIVICVPFLYYETLWFKIIVSLLIAGIFVYGIRLRYNYIKKKNDELERIIDERTNTLIKTVNALKITKNNLTQEIIQQKKLIGTISHDIKSPLKFLSITAKHLNEKLLLSENETIKDNAKIMHDSANQLYRFVENLVDYSKIFMEHNNINKLKKEKIDVIINEKINLFKNMAEANAVIITYKNSASNPINLNKKVIGIIIHNLLDNAIKNTVIGTITIETAIIKNKFYISIEDTGAGMPEEIKNYYINLQKNFETDKLAIQNYGLGLHMVLELLRLLKGDLKIYSKENEGTKITIILDVD